MFLSITTLVCLGLGILLVLMRMTLTWPCGVLCRSRMFQYGVKYWMCNCLVLCVALTASEADKPDHLASWHPLFLVATVNVVFSEKVTVLHLHSLFMQVVSSSNCAVTVIMFTASHTGSQHQQLRVHSMPFALVS